MSSGQALSTVHPSQGSTLGPSWPHHPQLPPPCQVPGSLPSPPPRSILTSGTSKPRPSTPARRLRAGSPLGDGELGERRQRERWDSRHGLSTAPLLIPRLPLGIKASPRDRGVSPGTTPPCCLQGSTLAGCPRDCLDRVPLAPGAGSCPLAGGSATEGVAGAGWLLRLSPALPRTRSL